MRFLRLAGEMLEAVYQVSGGKMVKWSGYEKRAGDVL